MLCSEAELLVEPSSTAIVGTPTESALFHLALEAGVDVDDLRARHPLRQLRQRTEGRMHMGTVHDTPDGGQLLAVKGRPDQVLNRCTFLACGGGVRPLTAADRSEIEMTNERLAGQAMRVLGVAYLMEPEVDVDAAQGLVWVGMVGIADPPRPDMEALIGRLKAAGIRPIMITGDQSATAYAVARSIGLGESDEIEILDSSRLAGLPPDVLTSLATRVDVFSRVNPSHKLEVVKALQRAGRIVTMTGDGINDGPALKVADVGVAMGKEGRRSRGRSPTSSSSTTTSTPSSRPWRTDGPSRTTSPSRCTSSWPRTSGRSSSRSRRWPPGWASR